MKRYGAFKILAITGLICIILCLLIVSASCKKDAEQLPVPAIGIDSDNNVFWAEVDNAVGYTVYVNDVKQPIQQSTTFDALTADGDYVIEVVANGDGQAYLDSDKSAAVKYSVLSSALLSPLPSSFDFFVRRQIVGDVIVVPVTGLDSDQKLFAQTLQGLCAKKGICVYLGNANGIIDLSGLNVQNMSISELVAYAWQNNVFKGYIKTNSQTVNLAKTACSLYDGIVASEQTLTLLPDNCQMLFDATTKNFEDIPDEKKQFLSAKVVVNSANYVDIGVMNNARFTSDESIIADHSGGIVLGEGKALCNIDFVQKDNLSALSMLKVNYLRNNSSCDVVNGNKHLVTLVAANNRQLDYLASSYTYSVLQSNLAPMLLKTAQSDGKSNDLYLADDICANTDWSSLSNEQKNDYCAMINICMGNAGMHYFTIDGKDISALDKLCYMSNIQGGFINGIENTLWKNGKPFCGFSATLTNDNAEELATKISAMSTDLSDLQAYTAVNVADSTTNDTIKAFYAYLNKNVQVVRADTFIETMRSNAARQDAAVKLPQQASASYLTNEHDEYDVYAFKFMPTTDSLYYLFTNSMSSFCAHKDGNASIGINESYCEFVRSNNTGKSYIYNKIHIPNWESTYLNLQVATSTIAKTRIMLYSVEDNQFETLYNETVSARGFEDLSFNLTKLSFKTSDKDIVIIIEQDKLSIGKEILKVDNVNISRTKKREAIYDKQSIAANNGVDLSLTADILESSGNVTFDNAPTLSSNKTTLFDEALASISQKIRLDSLSNQSYQLSVNILSAQNALLRIRLVDQSFISNIVQQWTLINGNNQLTYDVSPFAGQDIVLYIELCNTEYNNASFTVDSIKFVKNVGKYYYDVGVKDSFEGTQEHWNLNGWTVNDNVSYGDLTQESGFGSIRFDGSNNGVYNPELVIGRATKNYRLTQNDCTLDFWARSGGPTNATYIRVVVIDENGKETVLRLDKSNANGWTLISGEPWVNLSYDLSAFKGRNVTIAIEQTDHGVGVGEIAFIDSVIVKES